MASGNILYYRSASFEKRNVGVNFAGYIEDFSLSPGKEMTAQGRLQLNFQLKVLKKKNDIIQIGYSIEYISKYDPNGHKMDFIIFK
jgi:hypothetical protein